ncbi:IS5 family transposase [Streptomyces sp. NPDC052012]|uniref:IS5 family transposase n=1 Tax=Streptomyces sp. NPDC052012 TaxID=3155051 RepID=UPI00344B5EB9
MTDAEWQVIRAALPVPAWLEGRGGRPEGYCHRVMLDAVRYVVDNGVRWANLPRDFPPYRRVHAFARRWQITGLLAELHGRLRDTVRAKEGRTPDPTAAIVDSQSVRAAANIPRSTSGWDVGKKVGGRKRHLLVDCLGLVLAVAVTAASVQDRDAAVPLLERLRQLYFSIRLVWADGAYTGTLVAWARQKLQLTVDIVKRTDHRPGFEVLPRRWVVEPTLSWLFHSRRLVRDYEASRDSSAWADPSAACTRSASSCSRATSSRTFISRASSNPSTDGMTTSANDTSRRTTRTNPLHKGVHAPPASIKGSLRKGDGF